MCRWETPAETKASEKMDNKKPEDEKLIDSPGPKRYVPLKKERTIHDFDLGKIPSGVDIGCLMKEFVIPRMPDGYTVKIRDKFVRRKSSVAMTIEAIEPKRLEVIVSKPISHVREVLCHTDSPRPLHPHIVLKRQLRIIGSDQAAHDPNARVYMFSKLLSDLDELCAQQRPFIETRMEEISEKLSTSATEEAENLDVESEINYSEVSFNRMAALETDAPRKELEITELDESEESDVDSPLSESSDEPETEHVRANRDKELGRWSVRDVHDAKFNEDKLALQFRCGRLGFFGLAVNWYGNFPYQTWDLKPDTRNPGTVLFSLTAAVVSVDVALTGEGVVLNSFQGGTTTIVQNIVGAKLSLDELKKTLQKGGVNLFPEEDASHYCQSISRILFL